MARTNTDVLDADILDIQENKTLININKKDRKVYNFLKRCIDIIGGIVGIVFLIPITIFVYILRLVKHENDGPMFYEQLRIGKNGREFRMYKFRTMVMHADERLFKYLEENVNASKEYKEYKKLKNDPRITKVGSFLRKTSLDEFPQFINVLKGQMSLVGPRPYLYRERDDMGESYNNIITCKPGITGYWQVNGRNNVDFEERLEMDRYYIENRSMILDIKILFKTLSKIFKRNGAI